MEGFKQRGTGKTGMTPDRWIGSPWEGFSQSLQQFYRGKEDEISHMHC